MIGFEITEEEIMSNFEWAWMNLCTRCFGHYHLPYQMAMCPFIDLVNHAPSTKLKFFLTPDKINFQMKDL